MKRITRKLALSLLGVVMTIALVGTGALAYFQDTETSTANTFTAGTLDLKLADKNENPGDGVSATWIMENMAPGVTSFGPRSVNLSNSGTVEGDHIEIYFSHSINEGDPELESDTNKNSSPEEMARWIEITSMYYDDAMFMPGYIDENGNGFFDLEDLTMGNYVTEHGLLDDLTPPSAGVGYTSLTMAFKFNSGAPNDIQGDTLITTVTFTLNQDVTQ